MNIVEIMDLYEEYNLKIPEINGKLQITDKCLDVTEQIKNPIKLHSKEISFTTEGKERLDKLKYEFVDDDTIPESDMDSILDNTTYENVIQINEPPYAGSFIGFTCTESGFVKEIIIVKKIHLLVNIQKSLIQLII